MALEETVQVRATVSSDSGTLGQIPNAQKMYYTDHYLSVISTYIHVMAQTPLGRFVVDLPYKQVCNNYTRNRTNGSLSLSVSAVL